MRQNKALLFVFLVYLHSIRYFDWLKYNEKIGALISFLLGLLILLFFIFNKSQIRSLPYKHIILGFAFIPFLSILSCWLENGQTINESLYVYIPFFFILVYTILSKYRIQEYEIVKYLTLFAVVRTGILIVEQFTYPHYWFAYRPEGYAPDGHFYGIEIRSGIMRFYIMDTYMSMFLVFYYFQKLFEKFKWTFLFLFLYGLLGIYLDQQRQYIFSTILSLFIVSFFNSNVKYKITIVTFVILSIILLNIFGDTVFGEIISSTKEDTNSDNIRLMTYTIYGMNFWGGPLSYLFGNGFPAHTGEYSQAVNALKSMGYTQTDIGIVGLFSYYGFSMLFFFIYFYYYTFRKKWKYLDNHIRMFIIASVINLPLFTMFSCHLDSYPFWGIMLYLADLSIIRNKNKIKLYGKI